MNTFQAVYDRARREAPPSLRGSAFSLPVLSRRGGRLYDTMFVFEPVESKDSLPRPFGWILLPADGGRDVFYAHCNVLDFVSAEEYPEGSMVSAAFPKPLTLKHQQELRAQYLDAYEQLREFAFEENLSREQASRVVSYKQLFLSLCPNGYYPFYHALTPQFFHWLRLPLPERRGKKILPKDLDDTRDYQYQLLILENLQQLVKQFQDKIQVDAHKEKLFDEMHRELRDYKNGILDEISRSLELDVIALIDAVHKHIEAFATEAETPENFRRLLGLLRGIETDLEDLLYRHGLDPYREPGDQVNPARQRVVATRPADSPGQDRTVASRLTQGWEKQGRVVRAEQVEVYIHRGEDA